MKSADKDLRASQFFEYGISRGQQFFSHLGFEVHKKKKHYPATCCSKFVLIGPAVESGQRSNEIGLETSSSF